MAAADRHAPIRFLRTLFEPTDWVAIFLKSYERSPVAQRVGPVSWVQTERFQRWLRAMNAGRYNVFVSVNAIALGRRARTREAIGAVRHVFLDADQDGLGLLSRVEARRDLPIPSYVLYSSPNHIHVFWRVTGFDNDLVERLQKQLARELQTDPAATPVTQTTRLPGFFNHKRNPSSPVGIEYLRWRDVFCAEDLPEVGAATPTRVATTTRRSVMASGPVERARAFLQRVGPAVSGQCGDLLTFRVCCRLVRGFDLSDDEAVRVLSEWNARCEPPWSERELRQKITNARRYGREPQGGLL